MPGRLPNILLFICHDLGRRLGCYGAPVATPHLDRFAGQGVTFTNHFCTAAQCSPSRGSIMTGRYPHRNGLMGLAHIGWEYHPGEQTIPMFLGQAGYATHLFGAYHESEDPGRLGYGQVHRVERHRARQVAAATCEYLRGQAAAEQPFYACVGTSEPHRPYQQAGYPADDPATVVPLPYLPDKPGIREDLAGLNGLVRVMDEAFGQVMGCLAETGLARETLVIFTTDHGIAMPRAKGTCYDPGLETALILRLPGRFEGGRRLDALLPNVDLLPTLLELTGLPAPANLDGRSFLPLLEGRPYHPHERIFVEMTWHDKYNPMRGLRTTRHKYVRNFGDRPLVFLPLDIYQGKAGEEVRDVFHGSSRPAEELYDLAADPLEQRNLAADPAQAGRLADYRRQVEQWMVDTADPLLEGDVPPPDKQRSREGDPNEWPPPRG